MSTGPAPELHGVPYAAFVEDVERIAASVEAGDWTPDLLVGIGRGGLVPACYLSHRLGLPLLTVDYTSGEPAFGEELLARIAARGRAGQRILIIDDINDSGATLTHLRDRIEEGGKSIQMRVAVLIHNISSAAAVDYWGSQIDRATDKRWFVFPWEAMAPRETLVEDAAAVPERLA